MRKLLLLAILFSTGSYAETNSNPDTNFVLTVNRVTYSNVVFGAVTPSSVSFRHKSGAATVLLEKLPPDLQQRFGYDKAKADEDKRKVAARESDRLKRTMENYDRQSQANKFKGLGFTVKGKVLRIVENGILLTDVTKKVPRDIQVNETERVNMGGGYQRLREFHQTKTIFEDQAVDSPIFIYGARDQFVSGQQCEVTVYPAGAYADGKRQVACFGLSPEAAAAWQRLQGQQGK